MRDNNGAVRFARYLHTSNSQAWRNLCQKMVRTSWGLGGGNGSAKAQLAENKRRGTFHRYNGVEKIPHGAPVFSDKPGGSLYGHIFLTGGHNKKGQRIFWSTDITDVGGVDPVRIGAFRSRWGHQILGWGEVVNGTKLDLPKSPHARKAKKARKRQIKRPIHLSVVKRQASLPASKRYKTSANVRRLQKALNYRYGVGLKVNGNYNAATKNAYKRHQKKIGSAKRYRDGIPGPKDLRALVKGYGTVKD